MKKQILSGNEAVARGAYEAGCAVAAAYPGTPSTEILENVAQYKDDIYCQWACNEKVATEIAAGAAIGGARALAAMKHVGMNVAADPIFSMAYAGVNGGLVVVSADDPGCHSSQNEQDNRLFAPHAKIGLLEPSDSQECKDFTKLGFELSERFDVPMLLRMTTRICHSKGLVELQEREDVPVKKYYRDIKKFALLPSTARIRHVAREELLVEMEAYANDCPVNYAEYNPDTNAGVITSGISYQYAREIFGDSVSYLKLGLTYPLPRKLIKEFAEKFETLYVIEENDPYLENTIRALGFTNVIGKERIPICGELNAQIVREALLGTPAEAAYSVDLEAPARPPVMCAGCGHRGFFYALSRKLKRFLPVGDIGCLRAGRQPAPERLGLLAVHGRRIVLHHRPVKGAGAAGRSAQSTRHGGRLHLLPFRPEFADRRGQLQRQRGGLCAQQSHHRHDRPPAEPRHGDQPDGRTQPHHRPGQVDQSHRHRRRTHPRG